MGAKTLEPVAKRINAVHARLKKLDAALRYAVMPEAARASIMFESVLNLWVWYGLYDAAPCFSASEFFSLEYPVYAAQIGRAA